MKLFKNKKIIFLIISIFILIIIGINYLINKNKKTNELLPQEEISEEQYRQTVVTLYFINKNTGEIEIENRRIDVKQLIKSPYEILINMLILGGKNKELISYIPEGTKINKIELENNIIKINFSEEFNKINNLENKNKIINIIEKTLMELIEINKIEIINII